MKSSSLIIALFIFGCTGSQGPVGPRVETLEYKIDSLETIIETLANTMLGADTPLQASPPVVHGCAIPPHNRGRLSRLYRSEQTNQLK